MEHERRQRCIKIITQSCQLFLGWRMVDGDVLVAIMKKKEKKKRKKNKRNDVRKVGGQGKYPIIWKLSVVHHDTMRIARRSVAVYRCPLSVLFSFWFEFRVRVTPRRACIDPLHPCPHPPIPVPSSSLDPRETAQLPLPFSLYRSS